MIRFITFAALACVAFFGWILMSTDPEIMGYTDAQLQAYVDQSNTAKEHCEDKRQGVLRKVSHVSFACEGNRPAMYRLVEQGDKFRLVVSRSR